MFSDCQNVVLIMTSWRVQPLLIKLLLFSQTLLNTDVSFRSFFFFLVEAQFDMLEVSLLLQEKLIALHHGWISY